MKATNRQRRRRHKKKKKSDAYVGFSIRISPYFKRRLEDWCGDRDLEVSTHIRNLHERNQPLLMQELPR
jgi:hypothetical protein